MGRSKGPTVVIQHDDFNTVRYHVSGGGPGSALTITLVNASFFDLSVEFLLPQGDQRVVDASANTTHRVRIGRAGVVCVHAYGTETPVGSVDGPVREIELG